MSAGAAPARLLDRTPRPPSAVTAGRYLALDPRLRAKRAVLDEAKDAATAAASALFARVREVRADVQSKEAWLAQDLSGVLTGSAPQEPSRDDPRPREIQWLKEESARLSVAAQAASARAQDALRLFDAVGAYLDRAADLATLKPMVVEPVRAADLPAEVARIRAKFTELAGEEAMVTAAPLPLAEALAAFEKEFTRLAGSWTPDAGAYFRRDRDTGGPYRTRLVPDVAVFAAGEKSLAIDPAVKTERLFTAFLAAVIPGLRERWREAIKASVPPAEAIPSREIPKRLAAIAEKRRELEVREEATILTAADRHIVIDRRGEADPAIVLCTVLDGGAV